MSLTKPFAGSWWTKHLIEISGATIVVALLAGAVVFALVQTPVHQVVEGPRAKTSENGSAVVPLKGSEEPAPLSPDPEAHAGDQFEITCPTARAIPAQSGDSFTCRVVSKSEFSLPVALKCLKPPAGLTCEIDKPSVTPPPGGSVDFQVSLSNNNVRPGNHSFQLIGTMGPLTSSFTWAFDTRGTKPAGSSEPASNVQPPPAPSVNALTDYSMVCGPPQTTLMAFTTAAINCEVRSGSFSGPLNVKVISLDSVNGTGPRLNVSPSNLVLQPGERTPVTIAVDASNGSSGTFRLGVTVQHGEVYNFSASDTEKSRTVEVVVTPNPSPPLPPDSPFLPPQPPGVDPTASSG